MSATCNLALNLKTSVQLGYGLNYLINIETAVIVDMEPTPAGTYDEVAML